MKNKILSILTACSLLASSMAGYVFAAPSVSQSQDSLAEYVFEESVALPDSTYSSGPSLSLSSDTATESISDFGEPALFDTSLLMSELEGEGTEQSPYLISTADELKLVANNVNSGIGSDAHYKLTTSIDLGGVEWTPIGYTPSTDFYDYAFRGVFDGDGHTVSNFKITTYTVPYIGLFGLVCGGTIKKLNVDEALINLSSSNSQKLYAGALAGRIVTTQPQAYASVTECNVINSSVKVTSKGTLYAGGIAGSVISGSYSGASIYIARSSADCDIVISSTATNQPVDDIHMVIAGGLVGYLSSLTQSTITIADCYALGSVFTNTLNTVVARPLCGGFAGDVRTGDSGVDGTLTISRCYSSGTVKSYSDFYNYVAGGFAAQIYANSTDNLYINDCYCSSYVEGKFLQVGDGCGDDPTIGGFAGQIFIYPYSQKIVVNCYASGNVVDISSITNPDATDLIYAGAFTGYFSQADSSDVFENCYRFSTQTVDGTDICEGDYTGIKELSGEEAALYESYAGFDFDSIWEMDGEAEYFYPTLIQKNGYANFLSGSVSFATVSFNVDSTITPPAAIPQKASTISTCYSFSHWSLTSDGEAFDFENTPLTENTTFYAVFSSYARPYEIVFMNGDAVFEKNTLDFGSSVAAPAAIPEKATDETYFYTFLYWSETDGGSEYDFTDVTVSGNKTFYAVYSATDKSAWTGGVAESFDSGYGTEALPYIIKTADQFALLAKVINEKQEEYVNAHFALGANIHLGDDYWVAIGNSKDAPFSASFDGKGYAIRNFKLPTATYSGIFGYVENGTIKNVAVNNFSGELAPDSTDPDACLYVAPLAAYVVSYKGESSISAVAVTDGYINIDGKIKNLYAGGIVGLVSSLTSGNSTISDSYSLCDITAKNSGGYNYLGGISGRTNLGSGSYTEIIRTYTMGSLYSESTNSSRAGGITGYLHSEGSAYTPGSSTASEPDDENQQAELLNVSSYDIDIMIRNSFASVEIYSASANYYSRAGMICGDHNSMATIDVETVLYLNTTPDCTVPDSTKSEIDELGYPSHPNNLKTQERLASVHNFDFENTWTFIDDCEYPVIKCIVTPKPLLTLLTKNYDGENLDMTIQVMSYSGKYTVFISVYNERNQLIRLERKTIDDTQSHELEITWAGMKNADRISISALDSMTLMPLFESVEYSL